MNWPSMLEDINDRATASPPPERRGLSFDVSISSQRIERGEPRQRKKPAGADDGAAEWLARYRKDQAAKQEAQAKKHAADIRARQQAIEAQSRKEAAGLRAFKQAINDGSAWTGSKYD
jgi:hypothetical protein